MIVSSKSEIRGDQLIFDPIALLTEELKDKNLKKQALEEIGTIALVLTSLRIREELVPLLIKTFVQQNLEIRVTIVKSFSVVLEFLQVGNQSFVLLEFILDVLCAFSEEELRKQAYITLQKIVESLDLRTYQGELVKILKELTKETQKNIREVVLKIIRYVYIVAENENQKYLIEVLNQYKVAEDDQLLLAQEISQFVKIMPPFPQTVIHSLMKYLLKSSSSKVRSKLIEPIILLAKILDQDATREYFEILLKDSSTDVIAALIVQIDKISELSSKTILNQILELIDCQQKHDSTVRAAILEVLEYIPLTESRRCYILSSNQFKSLSLSKALADSLCKIHDIEALGYLIENSDTEFKNKLFPKLPSACQIHIKLMQYIFNQKNWRSKLTLLQNIEKRMDNQENVEIFIPKLFQQLGDKIGVLRVGIVRLISLIIKTRKIQLKEIQKQLTKGISSKNWFERQTVLLLMEQLTSEYAQFSNQDKTIFKGFLHQGLTSNIHNIKIVAESIRSKCKIID